MISTIDEAIDSLKALKRKHGGDRNIVIIDRLLTAKQTKTLINNDCEFDAVHTCLDEQIEQFAS